MFEVVRDVFVAPDDFPFAFLVPDFWFSGFSLTSDRSVASYTYCPTVITHTPVTLAHSVRLSVPPPFDATLRRWSLDARKRPTCGLWSISVIWTSSHGITSCSTLDKCGCSWRSDHDCRWTLLHKVAH